ncbi:MAG: tetratricopeptide repeat protein [Candidatus Melainabacteria bacterium]|nr:tetratricopeptide repeat protein [Candidatus Melainabacteria bacterium]
MPAGDTERELIDVATSLEYAAQAFKQKNYSAAEPIYRRALEVLERNYGAGDPDTIACLQSLGDIYYQMGRFTDAMPHYKRLLVIGEKVLGRKHPMVIDMVLRLASTYQQLGLLDDAETLFRRANTMSTSSMATLNRPLPDVKPSSSSPSSATNKIVSPAALPRQTNSRIPADGTGKNSAGKSSSRFSDDNAPPQPPRPRQDKKKDGSQSDAMQSFLIMLKRSSGVFISLIVVAVLIFCGYMVLNVLNTSSTKPTQLNHLKGTSYKTSDGQIDLVISPNGDPTYKIGNQSYAATITAMGPDLMDFKDSILSSLLNKEIWFEETPMGLQREDGTVLYSKNGPEIKIVRQLELIGRIANSWFQQRREYPQHQGEIQLGELAQNPISFRPEIPSVDRLESSTENVQDFVDVPNVSMPLEKILEHAENGKWLKEAAPYAGGIHCLNANAKLPTGDIRKFFAHGFDRNSKFIAGSVPGTIYLVAFSNGKQYLPDPLKASKGGRPPKLCIVKLPSNTPIWLLHYFTPILCMSLALLILLGGKATRAVGDRGGDSVYSIASKAWSSASHWLIRHRVHR